MTTRPMVKKFMTTHGVIMTSQPKNEILQPIFYYKTTCLIVIKFCIRLLKNYKTYGKEFPVDLCSN